MTNRKDGLRSLADLFFPAARQSHAAAGSAVSERTGLARLLAGYSVNRRAGSGSAQGTAQATDDFSRRSLGTSPGGATCCGDCQHRVVIDGDARPAGDIVEVVVMPMGTSSVPAQFFSQPW